MCKNDLCCDSGYHAWAPAFLYTSKGMTYTIVVGLDHLSPVSPSNETQWAVHRASGLRRSSSGHTCIPYLHPRHQFCVLFELPKLKDKVFLLIGPMSISAVHILFFVSTYARNIFLFETFTNKHYTSQSRSPCNAHQGSWPHSLRPPCNLFQNFRRDRHTHSTFHRPTRSQTSREQEPSAAYHRFCCVTPGRARRR